MRKLVRIDSNRWKLLGDLRLLRLCDLSEHDRTHLAWFDPFGGPLIGGGAILRSQSNNRYRIDEITRVGDHIVVTTSLLESVVSTPWFHCHQGSLVFVIVHTLLLTEEPFPQRNQADRNWTLFVSTLFVPCDDQILTATRLFSCFH